MWSIAASLPVTILLAETAQFYGLAFGTLLIWWWGAGFLVLVFALQLIFRRKTFFFLSVLCFFLFSFHLFAQFLNSEKLIVVAGDVVDRQYAKTFSIVKFDASFVPNYFQKTYTNKDSLVLSLVENPQLRDTQIINDLKSNIYLFAEHSDIENIKSADSQFNNDDFKRKSPWILYKPNFRKELELASKKDPLYCSNIGCTVKLNFFHYPIVWDYTHWGVPIILASGKFLGDRRIVFYGDSDPIVPFLIPYNTHFLRSLFNIFDYRLPLETFPIIISSLIVFYTNKKWLLITCIAIVVGSYFSGTLLPSSVSAASEFDIRTNLKIHSPHYDSNFSSLPAKLIKEGHSASINLKSNGSMPLYVINDKQVINPTANVSAIIFMMENAEIKFGENRLRVQKTPLGNRTVAIKANTIEVNDALGIIYNDRPIDSAVYADGSLVFVATNSPQLNVQFIRNVKEIFCQQSKIE
jgi:hypothetical protein